MLPDGCYVSGDGVLSSKSTALIALQPVGHAAGAEEVLLDDALSVSLHVKAWRTCH